MSRLIKFHAWDKKSEKMRKVDSIAFDDKGKIKLVNMWGRDVINEKDVVVQREKQFELFQFTGRRDKKKKEIFDGAILRYYSDGRMALPDGKGGWKYEGNPHIEERTVVEWSDEYGAYMVHGGGQFLYEISDESEVIGNILQDPALMEGWK